MTSWNVIFSRDLNAKETPDEEEETEEFKVRGSLFFLQLLLSYDETNICSIFQHLCRGMTLAVAYAANVGGTATLTGTGPNTIMKGAADQLVHNWQVRLHYLDLTSSDVIRIWIENGFNESPVTYTSWLIFGFPQAVINFALVYLWLRLLYLGISSFKCQKTMDEEQEEAVKNVIHREYLKLGPVR